jgi:hypothetical protein
VGDQESYKIKRIPISVIPNHPPNQDNNTYIILVIIIDAITHKNTKLKGMDACMYVSSSDSKPAFGDSLVTGKRIS